jgi:hypothetical protein
MRRLQEEGTYTQRTRRADEEEAGATSQPGGFKRTSTKEQAHPRSLLWSGKMASKTAAARRVTRSNNRLGSQEFPTADGMAVHRWDETAFSIDTLEGNSINEMRKWAVWGNYVGHGNGDGWLHVALEVMKNESKRYSCLIGESSVPVCIVRLLAQTFSHISIYDCTDYMFPPIFASENTDKDSHKITVTW